MSTCASSAWEHISHLRVLAQVPSGSFVLLDPLAWNGRENYYWARPLLLLKVLLILIVSPLLGEIFERALTSILHKADELSELTERNLLRGRVLMAETVRLAVGIWSWIMTGIKRIDSPRHPKRERFHLFKTLLAPKTKPPNLNSVQHEYYSIRLVIVVKQSCFVVSEVPQLRWKLRHFADIHWSSKLARARTNYLLDRWWGQLKNSCQWA